MTRSARLRACWRLLVRLAISSSVTAAEVGGCDHWCAEGEELEAWEVAMKRRGRRGAIVVAWRAGRALDAARHRNGKRRHLMTAYCGVVSRAQRMRSGKTSRKCRRTGWKDGEMERWMSRGEERSAEAWEVGSAQGRAILGSAESCHRLNKFRLVLQLCSLLGTRLLQYAALESQVEMSRKDRKKKKKKKE